MMRIDACGFGLVVLLGASSCGDNGGGTGASDDGGPPDATDAADDGTGCIPESDARMCMRRNATCGSLTAADNCGLMRTVVSCGTCADPQTCGGGGEPNRCGEASWNATYYVRVNGGTADQCDGTADTAYPGRGTGLSCAWMHPFIALPPGGTPRIAGGDRLIIGPGSYRMGYGAPGAESCSSDYSWDCTAAPIPSGPDGAHPTWIVGAGYASGCSSPPHLWGTERAAHVLSLAGSSRVRIECLEITDREECVESHTGAIACDRDAYPYGDWASRGIVAWDSAGVTLRNLSIHGLAAAGVWAGRLTNWTVENVRIAGNGWVGWDGDVDGDDANSGAMRFRRFTVEWNGCGETYPAGEPIGCWGQSAGGYGDGLRTGSTGATWVIEDSIFAHNTSDGLDLLYHDGEGDIVIERTVARGNAGNQIKTRGPTLIRNSVIVGDCGFFAGKPFTFDVDHCRALGNAVSLTLAAGQTARLVNNTIHSEGDCLVTLGGDACDGTETVLSRNNIFFGDVDFLQPFERTCLFYSECPGSPLDHDYGVIHGVKEDPCPVGPNDVCADPLLVSADPEAFDGHLGAASPARDVGLEVGGDVPYVDIEGNRRPNGAGVDCGAYEM